ncbi:ferredoxin-NADPH reductase [Georgenia sp. TF02-10]|uniref:ferredoxin-NADPH reductase n=1 Tax=Georgenia sp. TF02-10 TaxID=2917725 RepID=UPI001FA76B1F|nr:ferredoxin-NADPH reductase [Georgenia sp. TF02-10]UNX53728.1 ferredoxin-NADPH reductase [Georgenia sp. TF02-10]
MSRVSFEGWSLVFSAVYAALVTNVLLAVACAPLLLPLAVVTEPAASWPLFLALGVCVAPALCAAAAVFRELTEEGTTTAVRTFARAWVRTLPRAVAVGAVVAVALGVLWTDAMMVGPTAAGPVLVPLFLVLGLLALATGVLTLVALAEAPAARLPDLLRAAVYLTVRRGHLTLVSLVVLGLLAAVVLTRPAIGIGLAAAPLLYVVWANSRAALRPVLPAGAEPAVAG